MSQVRERSSPSSRELRHCAKAMLAPIIRILATAGLSQSDMMQLCASEFWKAQQRVHRKRLRAVDRDPCYPDVITRWATHPRYLKNGTPAELRSSGRAPSFASLVRETKPSLAPRRVLRDWRRMKLVRLRRDGRVVLLCRFVPTISGNEYDLRFMSTTMKDFLGALEFNILEGTPPDRRVFQRTAQRYDVQPKLAPEFNQFACDQAMRLLESVDDWLARHESATPGRHRKAGRLGLGIYVVNESPS